MDFSADLSGQRGRVCFSSWEIVLVGVYWTIDFVFGRDATIASSEIHRTWFYPESPSPPFTV